MFSTDKAVDPSNVIGATKRVAELYIENINKTSTTNYMTVRFGNVLDSDGSVVPLFRKQISRGGPVTVTHSEVTRFFMTIEESCQLILQAAIMGGGGEIFVLDMGEPVKISYMAEQMIRLSGLIPGRDIKVEYSGLRPGEKMYEELFYDDEVREKTSNEEILLAKHQSLEICDLQEKINNIIQSVNEFNNEKIKKQLWRIVPKDTREQNILHFNQQKI